MFKLQHPSSLISRLFILEYMRDLDNELLYSKANVHQKAKFFYKFTQADTGEESVDINWEYCLFEATLPELESYLKGLLPELTAVDERRNSDLDKIASAMLEDERAAPVDINVMDLAATEINRIKIPKFEI